MACCSISPVWVDALRCATKWQRAMAELMRICRRPAESGYRSSPGRYRRVKSVEEIPTLPSSCTCSHGTPHSALLCQGCVNPSFKLLKQSQSFRVGTRQELHQNDASYAPIEIDPEIGIPQARPSETSGTASTGQWFG